MKMQATRRIAEKLMSVMQQREFSEHIGMGITNFINENIVTPQNSDEINAQAAEMLKNNPKVDEGAAFIALMLAERVQACCQNKQEYYFMMDSLLQTSKLFHVDSFTDNPYVKNIKFGLQTKGNFGLRYEMFAPYELFIYDIPSRQHGSVVDIPKIGCFDTNVKYPCIFENNDVWMSVSPSEIYTMEKPIRDAKGKVLTLGCGMGYYAYMVSLKDDVESVTIVDREQEVTDLFEEFILPQFETRDKINIIKADAIEFMKDLADGQFDFCFADIWHSVYDLEPYFAVKELGRRFRKTRMSYWIEDAFGMYFAGNVSFEIMKAFYRASSRPSPNLGEIPADEKRKQNYIHELLKKESITRPEDVDYYMNPITLIQLINKAKIVF